MVPAAGAPAAVTARVAMAMVVKAIGEQGETVAQTVSAVESRAVVPLVEVAPVRVTLVQVVAPAQAAPAKVVAWVGSEVEMWVAEMAV